MGRRAGWWMLVLCLSFEPVSVVAARQPNVLLIYLDDFGWRDTGFMGSDFYETPHLDRLASEGMRFTHAYSCAANCAPARACLLSGQYTPRHEIYNVGTRPRGDARLRRLEHIPGVDTLDPQILTWAERFQEAGYKTASIGKWHLSEDPIPYGFDLNIGGTHSGSPPRGYYPPHNVPGLKQAPPEEYLTDRLNREAIHFIESHRDSPWLLYLTHFAVHTPLDARKDLLAKYRGKPKGELHDHVAMATMIEAVDEGVGRIFERLEQLELTDETIVVFTSDNGGYGPATDMEPLRGYKGTYYEGGIRVPLVIKWPGVVSPGKTCQRPVTGVDLYPTLCQLAGLEVPDQVLDGRSLVPLLKGENDWEERPLFWHFPAYLQAYRRNSHSESRDTLFRSRPCSIVRLGKWKLHQYFEDGGLELYNLEQDPGEMRNLAADRPEKRGELLQVLESWRTDVRAPVPKERNPRFDPAWERKMLEKAAARP